jgi:4-hydroxybenzoate polyprenyltransferase/phosphoserine phosphatase
MNHPLGEPVPNPPASGDVPLVVDLDGTLVLADTLHESLWRAVRLRPVLLWQLPGLLLSGKATFKAAVAKHASLDAATLPYHEPLLERLRLEAANRAVVLCTGADEQVARAVADHLGVFSDVMASDGQQNLTGADKATALVARFGEAGFDYVGNDVVDLHVFPRARRAWIVNPSSALKRRIAEVSNAGEMHEASESVPRALCRAMRPHQWLKNVLVFVPLLTATQVDHSQGALLALAAFAAFSMVASGVYLANDLLDLEADRQHPRKRNRPIAAGLLPIPLAVLTSALLFVSGLVLAWLISAAFGAALVLYVLVTSAYMLRLKRVPILDSIVLASLYTLRIIGGAAAISVVPSFWLLAFSVFFFMSLALGKRYAELVELAGQSGQVSIPGREYRPEDLQTLLAQGNATGCAAVVVMALYIHSGLEPGQYRFPELLWLICLVLLYWISKFWLNAQRREIVGDPVIWAATNRVSRGLVLVGIAVLAAARFLPR